MTDVPPFQPPAGWTGLRNGGVNFFKSNLFIFLCGQFLAFVCWLLIVAQVYGRIFQKFDDMVKWQSAVDVRIERMDTQGTNASKWAITEEEKKIDDDTRAIRDLQEQNRKIDVMGEKIARIDDSIKELKTAHK